MARKVERPVLDEIAGVEGDLTGVFGGYIGKALPNPDRLLRQPAGVAMYEDLMRDPQVRACMQTRRLAVVGREWEVLPGGGRPEDLRAAEFVREALLGFDFDSARVALLSGIVTGFKVAEVIWEHSEGAVWVKEMKGRGCGRFAFGADGEPRLLTSKDPVNGERLPGKKFQVFRYGAENGSPYGEGLGPTLYWPCWFKKHAVKFWMIFAEKFGSPTVVGKYPPGTPKEHQDALLGALRAVQQEAAIKIPETMRIEMLEAQRGGSVSTYEQLCAYMNREIAKAILGQTLTTETGETGSYAAAKTHDEVRRDYMKADADLLANALNKGVVSWLAEFNCPGAKAPRLWVKMDREPDLRELAARDEALLRMGVKLPRRYFYEAYGVPEPQPGEETL